MNDFTELEMYVNQACYIYKSYYFFCDVLGSLAARYCFDFKTERKPHRVCLVCFVFTSIYLYIELGLHQMYRHAIINPYLITRENKGRAGVDVKLCEHGLRAQLFDLVRAWTNECARSHAAQRKVALPARSFVSFEYFHPMNAFEMETIPLIEKEYDKGHHTLMAAPGKIARSCVACGTATVTVVQLMIQQLHIVVHVVEMVGIALLAYIDAANQITMEERASVIEGGELLV